MTQVDYFGSKANGLNELKKKISNFATNFINVFPIIRLFQIFAIFPHIFRFSFFLFPPGSGDDWIKFYTKICFK